MFGISHVHAIQGTTTSGKQEGIQRPSQYPLQHDAACCNLVGVNLERPPFLQHSSNQRLLSVALIAL
jgi:hypothetical protein